MELDARHLRVLLEVARAGSISAAARRLGVSQPALTTQLGRIERSLGCAVFHRGRDGVAPTPVGAEVLARAAEAVTAIGTVRRAAAPWPTRPFSVATHCLTVEVVIDDLPPRLRDRPWFTQEMEPAAGFAAVRSGRADLFAGVRWPHVEWPAGHGLVSVRAVVEPLSVMVAAAHPLAAGGPIALDRLADESWVAKPGLRTTERECAAAGFAARIRFLQHDTAAYLALVGSGLAVSFASPTAPPEPGVVIRPYRDPAPVEWVLVHDPKVLPDRDVRDIASALHARQLARQA
jgi:DNA-binding transcriptional LysR family regulator